VDRLKNLHWPLIVGLGALALLHPVLNAAGLMGALGRPLGPLLVMALISLIWLLIAALARVREPLLTLVCAGIAYGLFALLISATLAPPHGGQASGPLTSPAAVVGVLITNAIWGGFVGIGALVLQAVLRRP
jgi:hypothetical protein